MDIFSSALRQLTKQMGIQWAPINIPMSRRLQTLATFGLVIVVVFGEIACVLLFIQLLYTSFWWFTLLYGIWILKDIETCKRGGRSSQWVRSWSWWQYVCDYFPIKLVKRVDLDPSRNYLFSCHPHGILCFGIFGAFVANAGHFHKRFPGMLSHLTTLDVNFLIPFFRELTLALGYCSVSQESLLHLLDEKKYQGNCVCVVTGGAAEASNCYPKEQNLTLSNRKGIIRVAMKSGVSLVPVYIFGETDVYHNPKTTKNRLLRRFQDWFRQLFGISPMFFYGRGIFQYSYGLLPFRVPVNVVGIPSGPLALFTSKLRSVLRTSDWRMRISDIDVELPGCVGVGAPLEVKKNLEPTLEEIDAVHEEYTQRLVTLFETEKAKYLKYHEEARLVIT